MQDLELNGKRALVCGSSKGIGRATAERLAELGAEVTLCARDAKSLEQVRDGLSTTAGQKHAVVVADFDQPPLLRNALEAHLADGRPLEILVNNSGGPPGGPVHKADPEAFLRAFNRHLICNQILVQALLPGMRERGYGRIINIISTSVKEPIAGLGVSNTVRGAVASWAKTLAGELAADGITVNNVLPGFTETDRLASLFASKAEKQGISVEKVAAQARAAVPAGRFGRPEELAAAIAFLASPAAAYVNGINLPVDGGRTRSL
ncbi:MAG: SDR family oxidoreductase [Gammaproteobacteria bacterium]|jgi:3-oxoacyl-[acyl-carrier protein] reductase